MDLHKNSSTFCVKDEKGNVIDRARIFTRPSAIKGYLRKFKERDSLKLVLEPVSQWYFYADLISSYSREVTSLCWIGPLNL